MDDELHDYDGPGLPSITEVGEEFVCLPRTEAEQRYQLTDRAYWLAHYYSLAPDDAEWESMTPQEAYRYGQAFAARFVTGGVPVPAEIEKQRVRMQAVRDAWAKAQESDLPQGFGWPGDLFDALEAL